VPYGAVTAPMSGTAAAGSRGSRGSAGAVAVAGALLFAFVIASPVVSLSVRPALRLAGLGALSSSPTVRIDPSVVTGTLPPSFWGIGQQTDVRLGSSQAGVVQASPARYVVWPAGAQGDGYDAKANLLHGGGGTAVRPAESEAAFASWCRSLGCRAILTVPGEINDPSYAAWEVGYTERTLGLHPAYWEIGNEPAHWRHFGIPWSEWRWTQNRNATPGSYARVVQSYVSAMKGVDPSIRILGLPGLGRGAQNETVWINATVRLNGPRLSGVAIHVYPAGHPNGGQEPLSRFFASLTGNGSLYRRVPADRAAMAAACRTCVGLQLLVTEWNSATVGSLSPSTEEWKYVNGFPEVAFVTATLVEAMKLHVANLDLFALEENYVGSLINSNTGGLRELGRLYTLLMPHVNSVILRTSVFVPGLYAVAALNPAHSTMTLLLANANAYSSETVELSGSGFWLAGAGHAWTWSGSTYDPVFHSWSAGHAPTEWVLPASGIALVEGSP
jgi:hypothetical protein